MAEQFVPKFYRMNPETDDLLPNGRHLANGMRVLIAASSLRMNIDAELSDWQEDRALENNRWCTVGALEDDGEIVRFIGVYDDGSKMMRVQRTNFAWYVKKDSIREAVNLEDERYLKTRQLVSEAMSFGAEITLSDIPDGDRIVKLNLELDVFTKKILGLS
jgi:hypothetical protein